jgi:hypothetical protein
MVGMWQGMVRVGEGTRLVAQYKQPQHLLRTELCLRRAYLYNPHSTRSKTLAKVIMLSTVGHHVSTYSVKNDKGKPRGRKIPKSRQEFSNEQICKTTEYDRHQASHAFSNNTLWHPWYHIVEALNTARGRAPE